MLRQELTLFFFIQWICLVVENPFTGEEITLLRRQLHKWTREWVRRCEISNGGFEVVIIHEDPQEEKREDDYEDWEITLLSLLHDHSCSWRLHDLIKKKEEVLGEQLCKCRHVARRERESQRDSHIGEKKMGIIKDWE